MPDDQLSQPDEGQLRHSADTPYQIPKQKWSGAFRARNKATAAILAVVGVLVILGSIGCSSSTSSGPQTTRPPGSSLACNHFANTWNDWVKGQLTAAELRQKLKEVRDNTMGVATPEVTRAAEALIAASTADDASALVAAKEQMLSACNAAGVPLTSSGGSATPR